SSALAQSREAPTEKMGECASVRRREPGGHEYAAGSAPGARPLTAHLSGGGCQSARRWPRAPELPAATLGACSTTTGVRRLPLFRLAGLLVEALLLHVLEEPRTQHLAPELLQRPLDAIAFADLDLDHNTPGSPCGIQAF